LFREYEEVQFKCKINLTIPLYWLLSSDTTDPLSDDSFCDRSVHIPCKHNPACQGEHEYVDDIQSKLDH